MPSAFFSHCKAARSRRRSAARGEFRGYPFNPWRTLRSQVERYGCGSTLPLRKTPGKNLQVLGEAAPKTNAPVGRGRHFRAPAVDAAYPSGTGITRSSNERRPSSGSPCPVISVSLIAFRRKCAQHFCDCVKFAYTAASSLITIPQTSPDREFAVASPHPYVQRPAAERRAIRRAVTGDPSRN